MSIVTKPRGMSTGIAMMSIINITLSRSYWLRIIATGTGTKN